MEGKGKVETATCVSVRQSNKRQSSGMEAVRIHGKTQFSSLLTTIRLMCRADKETRNTHRAWRWGLGCWWRGLRVNVFGWGTSVSQSRGIDNSSQLCNLLPLLSLGSSQIGSQARQETLTGGGEGGLGGSGGGNGGDTATRVASNFEFRNRTALVV